MKRAITTITAECLSQALGMRQWIKVDRVYQTDDDIANDTFSLLVSGEGLAGDCEQVEGAPPWRTDLDDLRETN